MWPTIDRGNALSPFIFVLLSAIVSYALGQDINWDQQNYHYYSVFSLFHRHMDVDGAPAGVQTFIDPYPYIPFYLASRLLPPVWAGVALGALHGLNFWLVLVIVRSLLKPMAEDGKFLLGLGAVVLSAASPMTISEIGSSNTDIVTSLAILGALALVLPLGENVGWRHLVWRLLTAAFLVGAAISLKLTNGVYAFGFGAACLFGWHSWRGRLQGVLLAALGGIVGAVVVGAPWYAQVWTHFHNPVFPFYNGIFASPEYPAQSFHDYDFMPKTFLDGLRYPWDWAMGRHPSAEVPFRDVRFVLIAGVALLSTIGLLIRKRSATLPPAHARLLVFFAVSFPVWLYLFGIQRYAVALELLAGPVILVLLASFLAGRALIGAILAAAILSVATLHTANWGRIPWLHGASWYSIDLKDDRAMPGTYLLADKPLGYVVPSLPLGSQAFELEDFDLQPNSGSVFSRALGQALGRLDRPVHLLFSERLSIPARTLIGAWGLDIASACRNVANRIRLVTECDLTHTDKSVIPSMPIEAGTVLSFAEHGNGYPAMLDQWSAPEPWGVWGDGPDATMLLRLGQSYGFSGVSIRVHANALLGGTRTRMGIEMFANDKGVAHWNFDAAKPQDTQTACLLPALIGPDRLLKLRFHDPDPQSPLSLGMSADARILSIGLISLSIQPEENCPPLGTK